MFRVIKFTVVVCALMFLPILCATGAPSAVHLTTFGQAPSSKIPVVLSTDVGNEVDDQWTITWLLLSPRVDVLGVMSAHAPSITAPAGLTSYRILRDVVENRLAMRVHAPLIEGGSLPLEDIKTPRPSPAVNFLIEKSKSFSKENRLTVLMIGAGTDVASAILTDPTIVDRIRVIQMGFTNQRGGNEFNIANDIKAAQAILNSDIPLVIGPGDVCRASLSLSLDQAKEMIAARGPIGAWLWEEFQAWYYRYVKPLRVNDFSKPWIIWDNITLAYVLGMTEQQFVGPDNRKGARLAAAHLSSKLKAGDKIAILEGAPTAFNAIERKAGFDEAVKAAGLNVVSSQSAGWETAKANQIASTMITEHPDLKALLCANDSMALGAVAALKAAGKSDQILVIGFDNITAVQQLVKEGKVVATVDQHGDQLAVYGIDYALEAIRHKKALADKETPVDLITAETLR